MSILKQLFTGLFARKNPEAPAPLAPPPTAQPSDGMLLEGTGARKNKVLLATHSYSGNGAAEMLITLIDWLSTQKGLEIDALDYQLSDKDKAILEARGIGIVKDVVIKDYMLAVMNTVVSGVHLTTLLGEHIPSIFWIHEGQTIMWSETGVKQWCQAFGRARHIVFQSSWQKNDVFKTFSLRTPDSRISIIPNFIDAQRLQSITPKPKPPGTRRIVFAGGVYARKRPQDLVQAMQHLERTDIECLFIGNCKDIDTLPADFEQVVQRDKRLQLLGEMSRDDTLAYIASADVLCLPSEDESQPLALIEAALLGVPVIMADIPPYKDFWQNGVNCRMHAVGDFTALARCISDTLDGAAVRAEIPEYFRAGHNGFFDSFDRIISAIAAERPPTDLPPAARTS